MATQIGAQMFTLREHCGSASEIAESCVKLKKMGFGAIQASAAYFGEIEAKELKKILDDTGMVCAATHKPLDQMKQPQALAEWHHTVGCELTALGGFAFGGAPEPEWDTFITEYSQIGREMEKQGVRIGYHNHSHEFAPFGIEEHPEKIDPVRTPMHKLANGLDASVWFEIDTYWVAHGGADPAAWIRKLAGRVPAIHVKDMTLTPKREHRMCEVGAGNLNWPAILDACKEAGVQWYLIERDRGDVEPFESLKISLDNLRAMGLE